MSGPDREPAAASPRAAPPVSSRAAPPESSRAESRDLPGAAPRRKRPREPFFWAMFSGGGMLAALLLPAAAAILFFVLPLGWAAAGHAELLARFGHPLVRLALFGLVTLFMFHWAHRFRYTLYDGLQLYHLNALIAVVCYGGATLVSLAAAWLLATLG